MEKVILILLTINCFEVVTEMMVEQRMKLNHLDKQASIAADQI